MAEYSRIAKGHFTSTGNAQVVNLPFQPDRVEMLNLSLINAGVADSKILRAFWDVSMGQGVAEVQAYSSGGALIYDNVVTGGISSFSAGLMLQYGAAVDFIDPSTSGSIALTDSSTLTVTTTAAHGLQPGNWVIFQNLYQTSNTGLQPIAGIPFIIKTVGSTTTFTVSWNGDASNLTAITDAATGVCSYKQILYPELYLPGVAFPWSITQSGTVVTVYTSAPTNYQVGQQIAFNIPSVYGAQNLNESSSVTIPGSPKTFYVTSVGVVEVNSTYVDYFTFNFSPTLSSFNIGAPAFTSFPGLSFAQVKAVGDVNSGGYPYTGGNLYPSPTYVTTSGTSTLGTASTINGPAIQGAYFNNTSQGFIIGAGTGRVVTSGVLVGASTNIIYWAAYLSDYAAN